MRGRARRWSVVAVLTALMTPAAGPARAAVSVPPGFDQQVLTDALTQPAQAAWAPDGRIFVAEKQGRIRVIGADGRLVGTPVLDISGRVNSLQDRGLLGLAVDPGFATNHRLYYVFTNEMDPAHPDGDGPMVGRLERVTVGDDNRAGPPTVVLGGGARGPCAVGDGDCLPSDGRSHSIGTIRFGGDGTLWVGVGDGASYSEVDELAFRARNPDSLAGKILHIDANGRGLPGHPFCPGETDLTKACTKVHAMGFRNPYRFTLHGGVPLVGDVGWGSREEVDRVRAGGDYGWPCWEGDRQSPGYNSDPRCTALYAAGTADAPLYAFSHDNAGSAVVAGPVLPADTPYGPAYAGSMVFGDYATGVLRRMGIGADARCAPSPCAASQFGSGWLGGTDLELTPGGTLAWTLFGTGVSDGSLVDLRPTAGNRTPVVRLTVTPLAGTQKRGYRFSAAGSSDPDGDALTATWDAGDGTPVQRAAVASPVTHVYGPDVTRATVTVTVEDGRGGRASGSTVVTPGDAPPTVQVAAPTPGAAYTDGQPVTLRGSAADAEDGTLGAGALVWHVVLRHREHTHLLADLGGGQASFVPWTDHDADSGYTLRLAATDSAGNTTTSSPVDIEPRTVHLTLGSTPDGAPIGYGEQELTTPATVTAAVGFRTTLTAPALFAGRAFAGWSDGGAAQHTLVVPAADTALVAAFGPAAAGTGGPAPARAPVTRAAARPARCRAQTRGRPVRDASLHAVPGGRRLRFLARRTIRVRVVVVRRSGLRFTLRRLRRLRACHRYTVLLDRGTAVVEIRSTRGTVRVRRT